MKMRNDKRRRKPVEADANQTAETKAIVASDNKDIRAAVTKVTRTSRTSSNSSSEGKATGAAEAKANGAAEAKAIGAAEANATTGTLEVDYAPEGDASLQHSVWVCSLCLDEHDDLAELRLHFIEEHQYVESVEPDAEDSAEDAQPAKEIRPMAFRDFRCYLRASHVYRCPVSSACTYKFANADNVKQHEKCHVKGESGTSAALVQFKCSHCSETFTTWRNCSQHMWEQHEIDVDMLKCPVCQFNAHTSVRVWRHMRFHKKWRPRVMRSLKAVKKRQDRLRKLKETQESNAPPAAEEEAVVKAGEKSPMPFEPAEGGDPKAKRSRYYEEKTCDICDRKFVNGKTLSKHVKTVHNKIKPFICTVCGLKTARKASLMVHMRQHTGEKPLQCHVCKFATRDPSALHKHQLRHQQEGAKLKCEHCSYTCIQATALKRHIRLQHPDEYRKIACDQCSYVTINEDRLAAHKQDHRKGLITNGEDSMDASRFKYPPKMQDKQNDMSVDCFMPLESVDSMPHEPAVDTGGVTIPAPPTEDTQFPLYLGN